MEKVERGIYIETPVKPVPKPRVRTLKPKSPQIRPALIDTEDESSDEEPIGLVVVVPVADSSDKPITAETELRTQQIMQ
jgi:hypothetical protein